MGNEQKLHSRAAQARVSWVGQDMDKTPKKKPSPAHRDAGPAQQQQGWRPSLHPPTKIRVKDVSQREQAENKGKSWKRVTCFDLQKNKKSQANMCS
jgi:hypothetical protein